jgi:chaperonin cofactor prefoldin
MKRLIKYSILTILTAIAITSCQKQVDYAPDIALLKSQITILQKTTDSLNNALKITNNQLSTTNSKIDTLANKITLLSSQISSLTNELAKSNANIADIALKIADLQKQIDELRKMIYDLATKPSTLETGLVLFYPFTGNANDSSGNGRNGVVTAATLTKDRYGKTNAAYYFNGIAGTKIQSNYSGILGNESRTISVWVRRTEKLFNANHIISWGALTTNNIQNSGSCYTIFMSGPNGSKSLIGVDNGGSAVGNYFTNATDSKWHNYIFVYDQQLGASISNVKIFIDGILVENDYSYNIRNITTIESIKVVIGEYWGGVDDRTFIGDIDDVRLYNRVLNNLEITYLANH